MITGSLSATSVLNWSSGFILAFSMFFIGQPTTSSLFVKDVLNSRVRVMLGHQNGITALLLALALQSTSSQLVDVFSITLPAVVWTALFYFSTNYVFDLVESKTTEN